VTLDNRLRPAWPDLASHDQELFLFGLRRRDGWFANFFQTI
jgi:hypothetical protein